MQSALLTIGIPTYNRGDLLFETLETVLSETLAFPDQVRIAISDNGSTDGTWERLVEYRNLHPQLEISRHPENIGPDGNFASLVRNLHTPYFWLLGDDDLLVPGVLSKVLEQLSESPDIVFLKHRWFVGKPPAPRLVDRNARWIGSTAGFLKEVGPLITFMSCFVVKMDRLRPEVMDRLLGSYLVQFSWYFSKIHEGSRMLVIEGENLLARGSNSRGFSILEIFGKSVRRSLGILVEEGMLSSRDAAFVSRVFLAGYVPQALMGDRSSLDRSFSLDDLETAYSGYGILGSFAKFALRHPGAKLARLPLKLYRIWFGVPS